MKRVSFIISLVLVSIFFSVPLLNSCGEKKEDVTQIGAILPLTGNLSSIGAPKKNAMDLAVDKINSYQDSELKVQMKYEDSKGTPKDGLAIFQKYLSTSNTKYFYIDLTPIVNVAAPIINKEKVLTFAGSAQPEVTDLSPWLFRLFAGGEQEIEMIVDYLNDNRVKSIFVLHSNELYGASAYDYLKKLFEEDGKKILGKDDYPLDIKDAKNILLRAKNSKAEKIVLLGYGVEFPGILKQMKEIGIPRTSIVTNLGATNALVIALGSDFTDDITFVGPRFSYLLENNLLTQDMQEFVNKYESQFKVTPDFRAAYAYDTIMILFSIWKKTGTIDLETVAQEITKLKDYEGVSGKVTFKQNGDSYTDLVLAQYKQGKMILIGN